MAKFVWRLQRVLDVKKKQEQAKRMALLHLTEQVAQARIQLMMREEALRDMLDGVVESTPDERISKQALAMEYAKGTQVMIKALQEQIATLQKQKQDMSQEVMQLKQTTEGLERLRHQAWQRFLQDQDKAEQKLADELTIAKHARSVTAASLSLS